MRWQHPTLGLVPPNDFIPLAEEIGLIVPLGSWVLRHACCQMALWRASGDPAAPDLVAVNLSPRQMGDPGLVATVQACLAKSDLPGSALCLEITEGVLIADAEKGMRVLRGLKELGVRIAVDDFGTGYSSLSYLRRFPIDVVKIDRSFVKGLGSDPQASAIVGAIITMTRALGIATLAEGVEEASQLEALGTLGCDMAQGFLLGRPTPA